MAVLDQVVLGLLSRRIAGQPACLTQPSKVARPTRDDLVHVCLVAGVPNDRVLRAVEGAVEGKRQLHDPEVGGEMPAGFGRLFDQEGTDFGGELRKL